MAIRKRTIGGLTASERLAFSGDDLEKILEAFRAGHAPDEIARVEEADNGLFDFLEEQCRHILTSAAGPFEPDSIEEYAAVILQAIAMTNKMIISREADGAAHFAFSVGHLATKLHMKIHWEAHALRGLKNAETTKQATRIKNERSTAVAKRLYATWQETADQLWARNKHLSKPDVAKFIAVELGGNPDWIGEKSTSRNFVVVPH